MIKDNQQHFNRLHVIIDAFVIVISYILAWWLKFSSGILDSPGGALSFGFYMKALVVIVPLYLILYYAFNLYTPKRVQGRRLEFSNVVMANIVGFLLIFTVLYNLQSYVDQFRNFSREMFFYFFAINTVLEESFRLLIRQFLRTIRKNGYNLKHVLLVGYSRAAEQYIDRIQQNPQWGYNVRGILDDNIARGTTYKGVKVIGSVGNLLYILPENKLDEIAITLGLEEYYKLEKIVSECEKSGVHTKFIPDYGNIIPTKPYTEDLLGLPVINIRYVPLNNTFNALVKRAMDIAGSIVGIIVTSPLMLLMCVIIKLTSPGPLIYKQERVGLHNQTFRMYKFRSMYVDAEERKAELMKQNKMSDGKMFKMDNDPRIIGSRILPDGTYKKGIGNFIRDWSIDEFPQFFNVLKGDISLVGTRPPLVSEVEQYELRHCTRLAMKPGITGMWQISGRSSITDFDEVVKLDREYIENWNFGKDLKILVKTVGAVLKKDGAV